MGGHQSRPIETPAQRQARLLAQERNNIENEIRRSLGPSATDVMKGKNLDQLREINTFFKDPSNLANFKTRFPSSTPYPQNPVNELVRSKNLSGKSCGELNLGLDARKLRQCAIMAREQAQVNTDLTKIGSVHSEFQKFLDLPQQIRRNPSLAVRANQLEEEQKKAFYKDVQDNLTGLSDRAKTFQEALKKRNQDVRQRVISQAKTLQDLRRAQILGQDLGVSLQNSMMKLEQDISTKTRLIQINEESAREKNRAVVMIAGSFSALLLVILGVVLYFSDVISISTMATLIIILVVILGIALFVLRQPSKSFTKLIHKIDGELIRQGDQLNQEAVEWVDDNCECPKTEKKSDEAYQKLLNHLEGDDENNIWYDDGSGPAQKISLYSFMKGTGKDLRELNDGDDPDVPLNNVKDDIQEQTNIIDSIARKNQ